ncbi:MAG: pseudouridine synthase [Parabacteroides sp.]
MISWNNRGPIHPLPPLLEAEVGLPELFTYPFQYAPHPLAVRAVEILQDYLKEQTGWQEELSHGKMFGVLVVRTPTGLVGFLAAFSGLLSGTYRHDYFVPPVYDLQQPDGFFKPEEERISQLNRQIEQLEQGESFREARQRWEEAARHAQEEYETLKRTFQEAKRQRDLCRSRCHDPEVLQRLVQESQFQKAELRRVRQRLQQGVDRCRMEVERFRQQVMAMKEERRHRSALLQQRLFEQFRMRNGRGEEKDLCAIFREEQGKVPPAGAGECAAPKLLQFAFLNGLQPLAMAEFWWGASPKRELRRHGHYYPACQSKCGPILRFMLQGIPVEPSPLEGGMSWNPPVIYEDRWMFAIHKPAGMLSVPGKEAGYSVYDWAREHYPNAEAPMMVHRLDMATSGILLLTKTREANRRLQAQFSGHRVRKRYIALLDGVLHRPDRGVIDLPIIADPLDRPRQMVDWTRGKPSRTRYEVLDREEETTRVAFYPETGRTHQLRVHAAHPAGLDLPIRGDYLYGKAADRLYLHAEQIWFEHPMTGEAMHLTVESPF